MKEALIYAGAFVVALLLVWLLPLGFSRIGGAAAVSIAFAAALLAEFSRPLLSLWQTGLSVILLLAAASYLLDRRFGAALYRRADSQSMSFMNDVKEELTAKELPVAAAVSSQDPPLSGEDASPFSFSEALETLGTEREAAEQQKDVDRGHADFLIEAGEDVLQWEQVEKAALDSEPLRRTSDWLDQWPGAVTPDLEAVVLRDEAGGEKENEVLQRALQLGHSPKSSMAVDGAEDEWQRWMNEDERLHDQSEATGLFSKERDEPWPETADLGESVLAEMVELWHNQDEQQMEEISTESEQHSTPTDEPTAWFGEEGTAFSSDEQPADAEAGESLGDDGAEPFVPMQEKTVHRDWTIVVQELELNRGRFTPESYERCLRQCLQAPLSDRDYYVFSRLLLEHYARERKVQQLIAWIDELEPRFSQYPAIAAELAFWRNVAANISK